MVVPPSVGYYLKYNVIHPLHGDTIPVIVKIELIKSVFFFFFFFFFYIYISNCNMKGLFCNCQNKDHFLSYLHVLY